MVDVMRQEYRQLSANKKQTLSVFKQQAADLYDTIASFGESRELSIAKTKLEECVMWATKELTR